MMRGDAAVPVATAATAPLPHHPLVTPITQQDMMGGPQFQRMIQQLLRKMRGDRTNKNTISLKTMQQLRKNMKMIQYFLTVAYKNNYMYGKILINGFEPLRPFLVLLKWIDFSEYMFK